MKYWVEEKNLILFDCLLKILVLLEILFVRPHCMMLSLGSVS